MLLSLARVTCRQVTHRENVAYVLATCSFFSYLVLPECQSRDYGGSPWSCSLRNHQSLEVAWQKAKWSVNTEDINDDVEKARRSARRNARTSRKIFVIAQFHAIVPYAQSPLGKSPWKGNSIKVRPFWSLSHCTFKYHQSPTSSSHAQCREFSLTQKLPKESVHQKLHPR